MEVLESPAGNANIRIGTYKEDLAAVLGENVWRLKPRGSTFAHDELVSLGNSTIHLVLPSFLYFFSLTQSNGKGMFFSKVGTPSFKPVNCFFVAAV